MKVSYEENDIGDRIQVSGQISEGKLGFYVSCTKEYGKELAEKLIKEFEKSIEELAEFCANEKHEEKTASDYGISNLSSEEFAFMQRGFIGEVEKIYNLTPLQEGMLFHNLEDSTSSGYIIQDVLGLNGKINKDHIKKAVILIKNSKKKH